MSEACPNQTKPREQLDTDTPGLEAVQVAEALRDHVARRVADAVADGTLEPWMIDDYHQCRAEVIRTAQAWKSRIDALLAEHGLEVTQ